MRRLFPLVAYVALGIVLTWPAALHPVRAVPGAERTDLWDSLWSLWYVWLRIGSGELPYRVDGLLEHPGGGVLWVADPINAVLALPLVGVVGVAAGWTLLVIGHVAFAGIAAHRLGEAVSPQQPWAGWVAGVSYASAPMLLAHIHNGASEAVGMGWMAWAALRLLRLSETPTAKNACVAALALALTTIAHWYAGVGVFLLAGFFALSSRRSLRTFLPAMGLAVLIVLPVAGLARHAATTEGNVVGIKTERELATVRRTIGPADPVGYFRPGDFRSPDFRELSRYGEAYIHCHYLGWVGIVAALGALRRRQGTTLFWLAGGAAAVLACGPVLAQKGAAVVFPGSLAVPLPWFVLEKLPGFASLSLTWRIAQLAVLALAVLAGRGVGGRRSLALAFVAASLAETLGVSPMAGQRATTDGRVASPIAALAAEPDGALMNFPVAGGRAYLYEQTVHQKPLTGGLNFPNNSSSRKVWRAALDHANDSPEALATAVSARARGEGVRYLVVHLDPMARPDMHDTAVRALKEAFTPIAEAEGVRVYKLW